MTAVFLGLGSNIDPTENIPLCLAKLAEHFSINQVSPWYYSKAQGFAGEDFINLVVEINYLGPLLELAQKIRSLEQECGRPEHTEKFTSRCIDIDILLFGELAGEFNGIKLPRPDLYRCAYALKPLLDLYPNGYDPQTGRKWSEYWPDVEPQWLEPVATTAALLG